MIFKLIVLVSLLKTFHSILVVSYSTCLSTISHRLLFLNTIFVSALVLFNLPANTPRGICSNILNLAWWIELLNGGILLKLPYLLLSSGTDCPRLLQLTVFILALVDVCCRSRPFLVGTCIFKFRQRVLVRVWHWLNILNQPGRLGGLSICVWPRSHGTPSVWGSSLVFVFGWQLVVRLSHVVQN